MKGTDVKGRVNLGIDERHKDRVIEWFRVQGAEHLNRVHAIGVQGKAIEFWGKVTCPNIRRMVNCSTGSKCLEPKNVRRWWTRRKGRMVSELEGREIVRHGN
jgi:hypothetical protein